MNDWRTQRDELVQTFLERNEQNVAAAVQDLTAEIEGIKKKGEPIGAEDFLAYLNAWEALEDLLDNKEDKQKRLDKKIRDAGSYLVHRHLEALKELAK